MEWTATAISADVRAGHLTAREALEEALARIERTAGVTEGWQVVRREAARAEADLVDARADRDALPLAGVPVAIKDNIPVAGEPMRCGSRATDDALQPADHLLVRRLRDAGAVVVGLTRVPELCIWGATDSAFGITRNPWDTSRTPGGSSGGTAAVVAAGDVPIGHGNDGMGSIRIPAAACGLVGIKPGRGVVPRDTETSAWNDMAEQGPLATTVADTALMFSVLAGDPSYAQVEEPCRLRIAISTKAPAPGIPVAAAWRAAAEDTGRLLAQVHEVARRTPRYPATLMTSTALALWTTGSAEEAALLAAPSLMERRNKVHTGLGRALAGRGLPTPGPREAWRRIAEEFFQDVDVLVTPTLAQPPVKARDWHRTGWTRTMLANARYAPFAAPWNVAGWPAMSVPAGLDAGGRPVGVQLVGRPGSERTLLGVAAQIERLRPWQRVAPV
ncbi:amidase [Nocardioides jiangxiensis]|uniref:Amidase n=1 Tax=Nocardioides jiangxiensis TaxID=3064524 RepID=A0ABT9B0T3_9ACTN|nr:amidase [Nocardioides sp. WY-20]MDO7868434.1 amidase [Nocardioides sp. WY-20]